MAVNVTTGNISTQSEVVATGLTISRIVNPDCSVAYSVNLPYATNTYTLDENNVPNGVYRLNHNPVNLTLTAEQVQDFFTTPVTDSTGLLTNLGDLLASLMDASIKVSLLQ